MCECRKFGQSWISRPTAASALAEFEVISTLRTGIFGPSKKIRRKKDGRIMVWQEVEYATMTENEKLMLIPEANLLRQLDVSYFMKYHDRIIDSSRSVMYITMEYYQGGDLEKIIIKHKKEGTHVPEIFVWKILIQTAIALRGCHQWSRREVLHRDLKPANVFLDANYNVRLGDIGLIRVGPQYYMSPELLKNQPYSSKSDIWPLGCLLYELCALVPPFTASSQSELHSKILTGVYPRIPSQYSLNLETIIRSMIEVDLWKRNNAEYILIDSLVRGYIDYPCKYCDRKEKYHCLLHYLVNGVNRHGKITYEDTLAKERQLELGETEIEVSETFAFKVETRGGYVKLVEDA